MKTSKNGIDLICQFEGYRAKAYRDSVGVLTIGYGHTSMAGAPQVTAGMVITNEQAREILATDLAKFEASVSKVLTRSPSQNQFDAMVSLCYNIGGGAFAKSTVLRLFNAGDFVGAANSFAAWNKAGGKVLAGLTARRVKEAALFRTPSKSATAPTPIPATPQPEISPSPATPKPMGLLAALIALFVSIFKRK